MSALRTRRLLTPLLMFAFACGDKDPDDSGDSSPTDDTQGPDDTDTEADADADSDADSDTDADADSDADSDFDGALTYVGTRGGEANCDQTWVLTGTAFTGDCEGCDFSFDMQSVLGTDNSPGDCQPNTYDVFGTDEFTTNSYLTFFSTFTDPFNYSVYTNALVNGQTYYYNGQTFGPYFYGLLAHDDSVYGTAAFSNGDLTWSFASYSYSYVDLYDNCGDYYLYSNYPVNLESGAEVSGTLDCTDANLVDVWRVATDGGTVSVEVDTVGADTAFDAGLFVSGQDGCAVLSADDTFDCTFPPPRFSCPAGEFESDGSEYDLVVRHLGNCAGSTAEYTLRISQGTSATPTLVQDNVPKAQGFTDEFTVTGSGAVNNTGR